MGISEVLSAEELAAVTKKSDWRGLWVVFCQWAVTVGIFAVVALVPNPLTIVLAILLLGGRQLGFFVLTHECGHRTLFKSAALNNFCETWLLSPMDFTNGKAYMREHLLHHRHAGSDADPDLQNYRDYPISRARLRRKLLRDITGRTGWRNLGFKVRALLRLGEQSDEDRAALLRGLLLNGVMLAVMIGVGAPWLYLLWLAALIFVQPVVVRIRQIAEHAAVPDLGDPDPRRNTRTLYANPLVRLLICPHRVNFHIEHHLLASVPIYRLAKLHQLLRSNGYYRDQEFGRGYLNMLYQVTQN